jgi:hypothetical protein
LPLLIPDFLKCALEPFGQLIIGKLRAWTKPGTQTPLVGAVTDLARSKGDLILENALLRQQLIVLQRQVKRPKLTWRDRALFVVLASRLKRWKEALLIVKTRDAAALAPRPVPPGLAAQIPRASNGWASGTGQ